MLRFLIYAFFCQTFYVKLVDAFSTAFTTDNEVQEESMAATESLQVGNTTGGPTIAPDPSLNDATFTDATWVLISSFIIFTMQTGFGLLEAGCVSSKNEVNIMFKNMADMIFGGVAYWIFGWAFSFGSWSGANPFCGVGGYALVTTDPDTMGSTYVKYIFQLSFATTATTIVSGAMAERVKMQAYMTYAFFNIFTYSIVAHWVWDGIGWLAQLGVVDIAGSGVVHLCGGASALAASLLLGPRKGRFDYGPSSPPPGNGTNVVLGTFMLWWGWLAFNCGSTFGVQGGLWKLAALSAVNTLNASMTGGMSGIIFSLIYYKGKYGIPEVCNGVLGGLVGVTAGCAVVNPWEALIMGFIGGTIANCNCLLMNRLKIDDPVGAISVHGASGIWGLIAVGFFIEKDPIRGLDNGLVGVFYGGNGYALGVQLAAVVAILLWAMLMTSTILGIAKLTIGIRMSEEEEEIGADIYEHMLHEEIVISEDHEGPSDIKVRRRSTFGLRRDSDVDLERISSQDSMRIQNMRRRSIAWFLAHNGVNEGYLSGQEDDTSSHHSTSRKSSINQDKFPVKRHVGFAGDVKQNGVDFHIGSPNDENKPNDTIVTHI